MVWVLRVWLLDLLKKTVIFTTEQKLVTVTGYLYVSVS